MQATRQLSPRWLRFSLLIGCVGLPLSSGFAVANQQLPVAGVAVLQGRVTSDDGRPLPGVRIRVAIPATDMRGLDARSEHTVLETRTDASGDYRLEIPGLAQRTKVSIDAMMPGFQRLVGTLQAGGDARNVELVPGAKPSEANLALKPARYYSGTVVDEQGQPISGVEVFAMVVTKRSQGGIEVTATNLEGSFEVFGYPKEPGNFQGETEQSLIRFTHPDYSEVTLKSLESLEPKARVGLRVVLPTGHKITGTVIGVDGKPVARAMIEAELKPGTNQHKATWSDANGKFVLKGLLGGQTILKARATAAQQKAQLTLPLQGDKEGLEVRLEKVVLPADLKTYSLFGMKLTDESPALQAIFDHWQDKGVVILGPGDDFERLKIGDLAEGDRFWMVGDKRVANLREFVDQILKETGGLVLDDYSIRVVFEYRRVESVGNNTQYLKLTGDDIKQAQALADRFKAEAK